MIPIASFLLVCYIFILILLVILTIHICLTIIERRKTIGKLYWHIHHKQLLEMAMEPIARRRKYIERYKPVGERETRLRCLRPVKGVLPDEILEAFRGYMRANQKLSGMWTNGSLPINLKAREKLHKTYGDAANRLWETLQKYKSEIDRLHSEECSCPWDGTTLFPGG